MSVCRCPEERYFDLALGSEFVGELGVLTGAWAQNGGLGKMSLCRVIRSAAQISEWSRYWRIFWRTQNVLTVDDFGNSGFSDKI